MIKLIEFDYELIRDEEDEMVTYVPDKIPKELPNLVYIEGPNSSGKSTLLNILATGLYGLKQDKLDPALKRQMDNLVHSNHQELEFNFKIGKNNEIVVESVKSEKNVADIRVYENVNGEKKLISPDKFHKKYNLIYDIPQNPTERLNQLIKEIKYMQNSYGKDIKYFRKYLRRVIEEIGRSRNPELISQKRKEIEENRKLIDDKKDIKDRKKDLLDLIEKYTYSRFIREYAIKCESIHNDVEDLEGKLDYKDRTKKSRDTKLGNRIEKTRQKINDSEEIYTEITDLLESILPKEEKHHLNIWKSISFTNVIECLDFEDDLKIEIKDINKIIKDLLEDKDKEETLKKAEMYDGMIKFLEDYKIEDIVIPGVEKNVNEFIEILKEKSEKHEDILRYYDNLKRTKELLKELDDIISEVEHNLFPNIRNLKKKRSEEFVQEEYNDYERILNDKKESLEKNDQKLQKYEHKYAKKGLEPNDIESIYEKVIENEDIKSYLHYTESELNEKISSLQEDVEDLEDSIKEIKLQIKMDKDELERLESKKKHKFHDQKEELKDLNKKVKILESKFNNKYDKYITKLVNKDIKIQDYDDEEGEYYEKVFNYLGNKVGFMRHGESEYKVEYIDLINDYIQTKKGKKIRLSDMGTGQGQSAYLKGLLNTNDDRKIIAFFDEVAMMDSFSLNPIYEKFRELYRKDRLLAGIVVQKADEINIVSKMEE